MINKIENVPKIINKMMYCRKDANTKYKSVKIELMSFTEEFEILVYYVNKQFDTSEYLNYQSYFIEKSILILVLTLNIEEISSYDFEKQIRTGENNCRSFLQ